MHVWGVKFALDLLRENGFRTVNTRTGFTIQPSSFNLEPVEITVTDGRVYSAAIREFLDHPVAVGGMRVKQAPRSLIEFNECFP
jgi:hypothetical protein